MSTPQTKSAVKPSADHHNQAAECCDKAAAEHRNAAKYSYSGDNKKADEHAKEASNHCMKAQDHGKQAKVA